MSRGVLWSTELWQPPGRGTNQDWAVSVGLAVFLGSILWPLSGLVAGTTWIAAYLAGVVGVLLIGQIFAAGGVRRWFVTVAQLVAAPLVALFLAAPPFGPFGLYPGSESWLHLDALRGQAARTIDLGVPPIASVPGILVLAGVGGGLLAAIVDWYGRTVKAPAVAGLVAALPVTLAVAFVRQPIAGWRLAVPLAAFLLLLVISAPGRPRVKAAGLVITALATALALLVSQAAPGLQSSALFQPGGRAGGGGTGAESTLVDLGRDLRRNSNAPVAQYATDLPQGVYLRLTTLNWQAGGWAASEQLLAVPFEDQHQAIRANATLEATEHLLDIDLIDLGGDYLPLPWVTTGIEGLTPPAWLDPSDLTVQYERGEAPEMTYRATFSLVDLTAAASPDLANPYLASLGQLWPYLELPSLPEIVETTALQAGAGLTSPLDAAQALEAHFRSGDYSYSTTTPLRQDYDGDSTEVVARFLEVKSGYCIHFAVAMALMARVLGIPSRIATGYLAGRPDGPPGPNGLTTFTVRANQLHAWPELFIDGVGWVPFEPTPPSAAGQTPTPASPSPTASPSPSPSPRPTAAASPSPSHGPAPDADSGSPFHWWHGGLVVLLLMGLGFIPAALRPFVRCRRLRRGLPGAWRELVASAVDLGLAGPQSETVVQFGQRLANRLDEAASSGRLDLTAQQETLATLVDQVTTLAYGDQTALVDQGILPAPGEVSQLPSRSQIRALLRALARTAGPAAHLRARLLPASTKAADVAHRPFVG